ncbi:MAG: SDR family oxidoreductase [Bacillota bacterium]
MNIKQLFDLTGKVAIVTGGGRVLGKQMAFGLAEAGASVVVCSRKVENCVRTAEELKALGVDALGLRCDVTKPEEIKATVEETMKHFGKIDILINNAGASWGAMAEEMPMEAWRKIQDTNITGMFVFSQEVGRIMIRQGGGKIVNISSIASIVGGDPEVITAIGYYASKGAVNSFTRGLATEWARYNIHVNAIAPGSFPTDMGKHLKDRENELNKSIPLGRTGTDYELKGPAVFLASDASNYVTGQVLVADGGSSVW